MRQVAGCAIFICLLAGGGLLGLKIMQDRAIKDISFHEDTAKGVSLRFVKALAENDLETLQKYAHGDFKDQCPELMEKFRIKDEDIESFSARYLSEHFRERIRVRIYMTENNYGEVIVWTRKIDGKPMVVNCQL